MKETGNAGILPLLFVVAFVALIDGMDGSIINVALPAIALAMNTDTGTVAWVTVAYFMMLAGLILVFGRIASNGAIKKVLIIGLGVFTVSSFICGISDSLPMLAASRIVQGAGAAMMGAAAPMICVRYIPAKKLGLAMGVLSMGGSVGYTLGPAVGGFIVDALSWHWCFLINVPLAMAVLPIMLKVVPKDSGREKIPLDKIGSLTFFIMIVSGIYALERCCYPGEGPASAVAFIIFAVSLALFIKTESSAEHPMLHIRAFRNLRFSMVLGSFIVLNLCYVGMFYLVPFYMHIILGMTSSVTGLYLLLPSIIALICVIPLSRKSDSVGRRPFSIAACVMLTSAVTLWFIAAPLKSIPIILLALVLSGFMWALCGGAMASRIVEEISDESREIGSSLMSEGGYLGAAVGTALYAMMFVLFTGSGNTSFSDLAPEVFLSGFVFVLAASIVLGLIALFMSAAVREKKKTDVA